jgi:hypothetical protein
MDSRTRRNSNSSTTDLHRSGRWAPPVRPVPVGKTWELPQKALHWSGQCSSPVRPVQARKSQIHQTGLPSSPDLVKDAAEKVQVIRENLKAQMRQKSYHDKGTTPRHCEVGDYVYLKVSPTKGVQRFGVKGKLAPRYIGPYEVWQPAQENTVLSPKTDPLWSLSNNKVSSCR